MKKVMFMFIIFSLLLFGCQQGDPRSGINHAKAAETIVTNENNNNEDRNFTIREEVKGNNLYVECVIANFTFSKRDEPKSGQGYIKLYLNGNKIDEIYTAAFVVKGLPKGNHQLTVEIVNQEGEPMGIKKTIDITV